MEIFLHFSGSFWHNLQNISFFFFFTIFWSTTIMFPLFIVVSNINLFDIVCRIVIDGPSLDYSQFPILAALALK